MKEAAQMPDSYLVLNTPKYRFLEAEIPILWKILRLGKKSGNDYIP